jgi:enoyl-CoA hydratase/carnithine racemase
MAGSEASGFVRVERHGPTLVVINNNPARRNALTPEFYDGLTDALAEASGDPEVASVIITGEGGFFCAGGDLTALAKRREMTRAERHAAIGRLHYIIRAIRACPKPVIAAVEGGAAGAGVSIALACDLVVATRGASFTVAYVKVGLTPDGGSTAFLSEALPRQLATEMCLFGDPVDAERLFAAGMINRLVEGGTALEEAKALGERCAVGPAKAMAGIKRLCGDARSYSLTDQLERECSSIAEALGGDEAAEGISAFLNKRKPDYRALRGKDAKKD